VEVVSVGCNTHIAFMAAHEMASCYVPDQQVRGRLWVCVSMRTSTC